MPAEISGISVGDMVRVSLHGRRVGGWVLEVDVEPPAGVRLATIAKRSGLGPPTDVLELAEWAAWRWAGPRAALLRTASPPRVVGGIPPMRPGIGSPPVTAGGDLGRAFEDAVSVLRRPPSDDPFPLAMAAAGFGQALVLCASSAASAHLASRMERAGVRVARYPRDWAAAAAGATVVGSRAAVWAPAPSLGAVVVFDEHDEAYQSERAPTWHARDVALERARRAQVPCVLVSPAPTLEALGAGRLLREVRTAERAGWPIIDIIDRRVDDPLRGGLWSERLVTMLRSDRRVVCVLNRTGRSRLLACAGCGELARCEHCGAAVAQSSDGALVCRRCESTRPALCQRCGGLHLKTLRTGVSRAREELEALLAEPVVEVTGATTDDELRQARVYVGTEAVLHRVARADLVAFLDMDQELTAPRYRAAEEAMALLCLAARLVGARSAGGRVAVQTRQPQNEVLQAALLAEPSRLSDVERARRRSLGMPPFAALAELSGAAAETYAKRLAEAGVAEVLGPRDGHWLVRAADHTSLCDLLAGVERPSGRLRVAVDPLRI